MGDNGKALRVTFPNGEVWEARARALAEKRADYYACEVDGKARGSAEWEAEVAHGLADAYDLPDWVHNHCKWQDVAHHFTQVARPEPVYYATEWPCAAVELEDAPACGLCDVRPADSASPDGTCSDCARETT